MKIEPYKGVRDFYPEDQRVQNYIFAAMRRAVESYGYEEYNASVLESTELYLSKTSEEIVNEQTYTFKDRGDRSVTLRPEMTPTVARMVAARKRELGYPLRLYSIPNLFRYERPQRGRLREHWQLNTDIFGVPGLEADIEIIEVAYRVMRELGAADEMFKIKVNSRKSMEAAYRAIMKDGVTISEVFRLLDKKAKLNESDFQIECEKIFKHSFKETPLHENPTLASLATSLEKRGIKIELDSTILRGFDYYTDVVFEVFDTNPKNTRSLFGGGRYDNLVGQYGSEEVPAVGFGMGDVTARDFIETHNLLPKLPSTAQVYLAPVRAEDIESTAQFADGLRAKGVNVALGMKHEKVGDHIKNVLKLSIPYFIAYGEKEKTSGHVTLKELATEAEEVIPMDKLAERLLR